MKNNKITDLILIQITFLIEIKYSKFVTNCAWGRSKCLNELKNSSLIIFRIFFLYSKIYPKIGKIVQGTNYHHTYQ